MENRTDVERLTLSGGLLYGRSIRPRNLDVSETLPADASPLRAYRCRFVRAGPTRAAGNRPGVVTIAPQALTEALAAGLFEARAVFLDHAALAPSVRDLVGVTDLPTWDEQEQAVHGVIRLNDSPAACAVAQTLDGILNDIAAGQPAPDIGLSMVFWATPEVDQLSTLTPALSLEGRGGLREVQRITHVESIDIVFEPAADGRFLAALSAANVFSSHEIGDDQMNENQTPNPAPTQPSPIFTENGGGQGGGANGAAATVARIRPVDMSRTLIPSLQRLSAAQAQLDCADPVQAAARQQEWTQALQDLTAAIIIAMASLPPAAQARLSAQHFNSPAELEAAIQAEREAQASARQGQVVQVGGQAPRGGHIQVGMEGLDQVRLATEALITGGRPGRGVRPLSGIRELYTILSGDYEMTGMFYPERVQLANVDSSTMAGLVANALNKRIANLFQQYPAWWLPIVTEEDFTTLQQVKWITLGGVGELPTVSEGAAYSELTWDDQTETAAFVKKGGYLGLTLEAMDKDDTRKLQAAPRALAQAAWLTLSKAISAIFTSNGGVGPTLSDTKALFHNDHGNLGATALSLTSFAAARTAMRKQTELNSSERLGALTAPKYLLVPPDLEIAALQVLASEYDYTYTSGSAAAPANPFAVGGDPSARLEAARSRVIVVDLWTDTDNWAAVADPRLYPTIGLGYRYGRTPEIFSVASPTAGLMFSNDTMPIKVRFFFAAGPMDYRGLYKANVG